MAYTCSVCGDPVEARTHDGLSLCPKHKGAHVELQVPEAVTQLAALEARLLILEQALATDRSLTIWQRLYRLFLGYTETSTNA